jgi:hypothetical protein
LAKDITLITHYERTWLLKLLKRIFKLFLLRYIIKREKRGIKKHGNFYYWWI